MTIPAILRPLLTLRRQRNDAILERNLARQWAENAEAENVALHAENAELRAENKRLVTHIAQLEAALGDAEHLRVLVGEVGA